MNTHTQCRALTPTHRSTHLKVIEPGAQALAHRRLAAGRRRAAAAVAAAATAAAAAAAGTAAGAAQRRRHGHSAAAKRQLTRATGAARCLQGTDGQIVQDRIVAGIAHGVNCFYGSLAYILFAQAHEGSNAQVESEENSAQARTRPHAHSE